MVTPKGPSISIYEATSQSYDTLPAVRADIRGKKTEGPVRDI